MTFDEKQKHARSQRDNIGPSDEVLISILTTRMIRIDLDICPKNKDGSGSYGKKMGLTNLVRLASLCLWSPD